jgi:hypothetical protein
VPAALDGLALRLDFNGGVAQGTPAILAIDFLQPLNDFVCFHSLEGLVLHVAIDVRARNEWMKVTFHIDLQLQVAVVLEKLGHFGRLKGCANSFARTTEITEVKSDVLQLWDTPRNHLYKILI